MKPLERLSLMQTNRPCDTVEYWNSRGSILLDPPYQRGDVWGPVRQRNLIKSILIGVPIPSIIINDRTKAGWSDTLSCVVIDGRQRLTTIMKFLAGDLDVPAEWFGITLFKMVTFNDLSEGLQRRFGNQPIAFSEGSLPSLAAEEEVFNLVNFGGGSPRRVGPMTLCLTFAGTAFAMFLLQVHGYALLIHIRRVTAEVEKDFGRVERVYPKYSLKKP